MKKILIVAVCLIGGLSYFMGNADDNTSYVKMSDKPKTIIESKVIFDDVDLQQAYEDHESDELLEKTSMTLIFINNASADTILIYNYQIR